MPYAIDDQQQYLTPTEAMVLLNIAKGRTHKEIAALVYRAQSTVKTHVESISLKLGSKNAANMVMRAVEKGVIKLLSFMLVCVISFNCVVPRLDDKAPLRRPPRVVRLSRTIARVRVERLGGMAA